MTPLLNVYEESCRALHVTPNSALCNYFAAINAAEPLHVLSLSTNHVGPCGLRSLLPVWHLCRHTLHTLDLSYNNLDSNAVRHLARWLLKSSEDGLSALRRLELRGNPFTYQAGKCLVHCCEGLRPAPAKVLLEGDDKAGEKPEKAARTHSLSNACTLAAGVKGDATNGAACYWEEVPGMQIDYVGIEETLMPLGLQHSLQNRIAAAIARREQRRRQWPHSSYHTRQPLPQPQQQERKTIARSRFGSNGSNANHHRSNLVFDTSAAIAVADCKTGQLGGSLAQQGEKKTSLLASLADAAPAHTSADLFDELDEDPEEEDKEGENALYVAPPSVVVPTGLPPVKKTAFDILDELGLGAVTGAGAAGSSETSPSWMNEM